MRKGVWILVGIILIVVIILILSLLNEAPKTAFDKKESQEIQETAPSSTMKLDLVLLKAPALNEETKLIVNITSIVNATDTIANVILPGGFELVNGDVSWSGSVSSGVPVYFAATVKAVQIGNWTIEANARSPPTGRGYTGGRDFIYVSVLEDRGIIYDTPFLVNTSDFATQLKDFNFTGNISDKNLTPPEPVNP